MVKKTRINELKAHLKNKKAESLYLFFGEEEYGKKLYLDKLLSLFDFGGFEDFNKIILDGKKSTGDYDDAIDSFPMMCEKKVVIIKDSGIFKKAKEDEKDYWQKRFENIPDYLTVIFDEKETDKRNALYKLLSKKGFDIEFNFLDEADLVTWVMRYCMNERVKIQKDVAQYLVTVCDSGMQNVKNELDKLIAFVDDKITKYDVEKIVSKAVGVRVFELTDCIMAKNTDKALSILRDLKTVKEPAFKILYLLFSTFDKMLHCLLLLSEGKDFGEIAQEVSLSPFIVKKYIQSARSFGQNYLAERVCEVAKIDLAVKNGEIGDWNALEDYVISACEKIK